MNKVRRNNNFDERHFGLQDVIDNCDCIISYIVSHGEDQYRVDVEFTEHDSVWNISIYAIIHDGNNLRDKQVGGDWTKNRPSEDRIFKVVESEVRQWYKKQFGIP